METDYISREAALDFLIPAYDLNISPQDQRTIGDRFGEFLKSIPAADVRPVIPAQWIALDIYRSEGNYKCSNCGQPCYVPECIGEPMYSVCPNCGAKMGGQPC